MSPWFSQFPPWVSRAVASAAVFAASYLAGLVVGWLIRHRMRQWAERTSGQWDDIVVNELASRVPLWTLLLGIYLAAGFWQLRPNVENALTKALFTIVVLSLTFLAATIVTRMSVQYSATLQQALPVTSLTQNIAKGVVVTIGLLIVLNGLGLSITPILTALGVGGLAVALALQDTLANLFAGIYITIAEQIRVGDYVRLDTDQEGYVTDIGWRSTSIRMLPNNMVIVPNARLSQAIVINYYMPDKELAVLLQVGVDYASDLAHVERVTCDVARDIQLTVPGGAQDFVPFIRYHTFGDSSVNFTVILRGREYVDQHLLKHEFIKRLHERYAREGIAIPFPIRTIVTRDAGTSP